VKSRLLRSVKTAGEERVFWAVLLAQLALFWALAFLMSFSVDAVVYQRY